MNFASALHRPLAAALLLALAHAGAPAAPAPATPAGPRLFKPQVERSALELPVAPARRDRTATATAAGNGPRLDGNGTVLESDDHLIMSHRFQELDGACNVRGWLEEDRTTRVYGHVDSRFVTNSAYWSAAFAPSGVMIQHPAPLDTNPIHIYGVIAAESPTRVVWLDNNNNGVGIDAFTFDRGANLATLRADGTGLTRAQSAVIKPNGDLIVADENRLYRYTTPGSPPVPIAGATGGSSDDTLASAATLTMLYTQLQADAAGNVWFSEPLTGRIRMLRANDNRIVTMLGAGGAINSEALIGPRGFAFDVPGNRIYVLDSSSFSIYSYDLSTQARTLFAGGNGDGIPLFVKAAVVDGDLYASAFSDGRLYRVPQGAISFGDVEVVAGQGRRFGSAATRTDADRFANSAIHDLAADGAGGILFTSEHLPLVLRYDTATRQLELAGGAPTSLDMGSRAFWVGADMNSAPDEVRNWVVDHGYGNSWGQWLESPSIPLGGTSDVRLSFDMALELSAFFENEYVDVLVQDATGAWQGAKFQMEVGGLRGPDISNFFGSYRYAMTEGVARLTVHLNGVENSGLVLGASTRFRIYTRTNAFVSAEDGYHALAEAGGAIFDNLRVTDAGSDLIPPVDFEDGGTGGWTAGARNFAFDGNNNTTFTDLAPAGTEVRLEQDYDPANTSCVWTFLSPGDSVGPGVVARLTSPWIRRYSPGVPLLINFSGKLPTVPQKRFMSLSVRGKNVGEARPSLVSPGVFLYNSGAPGGDATSAYINRRQLISILDLQSEPARDSIQLVIEIQERERAFATMPASRLPFLDEIELMELGADTDYDGIADAIDACPAECAAGQDADGDGCVDPTATMRHVESWSANRSVVPFVISTAGLTGVSDGSDAQAVRLAATAWRDVPGAVNRLDERPPVLQTSASSLDGVNLVTFQDEGLSFPPSVLAVTPTLSFNRTTNFGDRVVPMGEIVDADVIVNGDASLATSSRPGDFDLKSVMTHEFGHLLGLGHSGVKDATMYFVQLPAEDAFSLEDDDRAALAAAYPDPSLATGFATIRGTVLRDTTGAGLPGALVTAVRLDAGGAPMDTVASDYTDEQGRYRIFRLPAGDYGVHIQALDGSVLDGLAPAFISERLALIADTSFDPEWYSAGDSFDDDPAIRSVLTLAAGDDLGAIDLVSNLDTTAPQVTSISPVDGTTDVGVDATILVNFSEPVDAGTLQAAFALRVLGGPTRLAGSGILSGFGRTFVFTPEQALRFETDYELTISTALADGNGVHPTADAVFAFRTQAQPPVSIADVQPRNVLRGGTLTVTGAGFDPDSRFANAVVVLGQPDTLPAGFVTPTSLVLTLPGTTPTGPCSLVVVRFSDAGIQFSNVFVVNVVPPAAQASPALNGSAIPLPFVPRDVVLSSDGTMAYVAGDGGFATVNLDPARATAQPAQHPLRVAVPRLAGTHARVVLSTDGQRAYVSVPGSQAILEIDAVPTSVTFGAVRDSIPVTGDPFGLAVGPTGKRLWYTDATAFRIGEVNVDQASAGKNLVVRELPVPNQPNGGLTVDDAGLELRLTSGNNGHRIDLATGVVTTEAVGVTRGGVVMDLYNHRSYYAAGFAGVRRVVPLSFIATTIGLGGSVPDLARSPIGPSIFAINDATNRMSVIDSDSTSAGFGNAVAEVATGSAPAAVAVNANGGTIAVANAGDQSLSLYQYGATAAPVAQRVVPAEAITGQLAGVQGDASSQFTAGTQVDLAAGSPFTAQNPQGSAVGFTVPSIAPQQTSVTIEQGDGQRTLGLPFRVVPAIGPLAPRLSDLEFPAFGSPCLLPNAIGEIAKIALTPDGRRLAVLNRTDCNVGINVYSLVDEAPQVLGSRLLSGLASFSSVAVDDIAIGPDGRTLWFAAGGPGVPVVDIDPASPTAGQILSINGGGLPIDPQAVLADPLGRFMIVATTTSTSAAANSVSFWSLETLDSILGTIAGAGGWSLAAGGDGRLLVVGGTQVAHVCDLGTRTLLATSTPRGSSGGRYLRVAVSRDGRFAMGLLHEPSAMAVAPMLTVWNLDANAGALGAELFHGAVPGMPVGNEVTISPGSDATSFMVHAYNQGALLRLTPAGGTVNAEAAALPFTTTVAALSADGRRLWVARDAGPVDTTPYDGELVLHDMSRATRLGIVSGNGQSALAGSLLPVPVRVRVTTALGEPEPGVPVRFRIPAENGTIGGTDNRTEMMRLTDSNGEAEIQWQLPPVTLGFMNMTVYLASLPGEAVAVSAEAVADNSAIPPVLVELGPADGATGINAGTQLFARFNQPMQAGIASSLTLLVNNAAVTTRVSQSDGGRFVLVTPVELLPFGATCRLEVAAGALDTDGQALTTGGQASFTVQSPPGLTVTSVSPPSGPVGATIAINGEGFSATPSLNTVRFNGTVAEVASATLTSLVCIVPKNATSGPLSVEVGGEVNGELSFFVLLDDGVGGALGDLPATNGIRDIAVTPDGSRVYVTNPSLNTVSALQVADAVNLGNITVGLRPQGVAITPDGDRAYTANTGSNDVSVIATDPDGADYNKVVKRIPVGPAPVDVAISGTSKVVVVNSGDGTLSVIEGNPANVATYDRVTATVNCGAQAQAVAVSADGTRAYVAVEAGLAIVDLLEGAVTTTVNCGAQAQAVAISADNTLALVLVSTGELKIVQLAEGQQQYQVVTSVNCGAQAQAVAVSADGTRAFVTLADGATVLVFEIRYANGAQASSIIPGPSIRLVPEPSVAVGEGPVGLAVDQSGVPRIYVANSVSGTVTIIGFPGGLPTLPVEFTITPHALNLRSMGKWVKGVIEPVPPALPEDIRIETIRLNGSVGVDPAAEQQIGDADGDGLPDLTVRFLRAEMDLAVDEGDEVPVTVTGLIGGRNFAGVDEIKVKRGSISAPAPMATLHPGATFDVQWATPTGVAAQWVQVAHSLDGGATWTVDATGIPNTGTYAWEVPMVAADSVRLAVAIVEVDLAVSGVPQTESLPGFDPAADPESETADQVLGVLAMSGPFRIFGTTDVEAAPASLQFARIQPNPARSAARLRFGLPQRTDVALEVFDLQGRRVATLARGIHAPGWHELEWGGRGEGGSTVDAGLYFVRFKAAGREMSQRLVWLK